MNEHFIKYKINKKEEVLEYSGDKEKLVEMLGTLKEYIMNDILTDELDYVKSGGFWTNKKGWK